MRCCCKEERKQAEDMVAHYQNLIKDLGKKYEDEHQAHLRTMLLSGEYWEEKQKALRELCEIKEQLAELAKKGEENA